MPRTLLITILVGALVVLSGCLAVPSPSNPGESDVRVEVSNDHQQRYVVTVGAAPPGHAGLAVEFTNGTVREFADASDVDDLPDAVVPRAVSIRPVGQDVQTRIYRWDGPASATSQFEAVPRNATVYYSVARPTGDEPLRTTGTLSCSAEADLVVVSIRINTDGSVGVGNECSVTA